MAFFHAATLCNAFVVALALATPFTSAARNVVSTGVDRNASIRLTPSNRHENSVGHDTDEPVEKVEVLNPRERNG